MRHDRMSVLTALQTQGVVPVFFHPEPEVCIRVVEACAAGGAPAVEFTNRGEFAAQTFLEVARHFAKENPDVIPGVGSIVDAPTAGLYIANGARFVVGPMLNAEVARLCNRRMIAYAPGCGTVTEISEAHELGCEIVKMFPGAQVGGPDFVRAVLGPMPWTKIMPTGGVDPDEVSLKAWFGAGVVAAGIGSKLISKDLVEAGDWASLESRVREVVQTIRNVRG